MIKKFLKNIGMDKNEMDCYLFLIKNGTSIATIIAKDLSLNRSTIHFTLNNLISKKFVMSETVGNTIHFTAESPERIEHIIDSEISMMKRRKVDLMDCYPEFEKLQSEQVQLPKVRVYSGDDGLRSALMAFMHENKGKELLSFSSLDYIQENPPSCC